MTGFKEKHDLPHYPERDSHASVLVEVKQFRMQPYIRIDLGRCHEINLSPEAVRILVSALYGAIEHIEASDTPTGEEIAPFTPGDLVSHPTYAGNYWVGNGPRGCIVYGLRGNMASLMVSPGDPIIVVPISSITLVQKQFRPRHWYPE